MQIISEPLIEQRAPSARGKVQSAREFRGPRREGHDLARQIQPHRGKCFAAVPKPADQVRALIPLRTAAGLGVYVLTVPNGCPQCQEKGELYVIADSDCEVIVCQFR